MAQISVRARQVRIELNGPLARRFRAFEIALPPKMSAPISVRFGEIRIRRDGAAKQIGSAVVIVESLQSRREIAHRLWKVGPESESAPEGVRGLCEVFEFVQNDAEIVGRFEIFGREV